MKSYSHFTLSERKSLAGMLGKKSYRQIARELGRSPSSISREVKRNLSQTKGEYNEWRATTLYLSRRRNCKRPYLVDTNPELKEYVINKLNELWSPEIISFRCKQEGLSIAFTTIYRAIKKRKLENISEKTHLRRHGKLKYKHGSKSATIKPERTIHERPEVCNNRLRLGDFEGDTVSGAIGKGCLVTLVDRQSRFLIAARSEKRDAKSIKEAIERAFKLSGIDIPLETITLDRGSEFALYKELEKDLDAKVYFADPHAPWQRGTNENTNDMLRFFFPKGCNFLEITDEEVASAVNMINNRPRKCLGYLSPMEFLASRCCN